MCDRPTLVSQQAAHQNIAPTRSLIDNSFSVRDGDCIGQGPRLSIKYVIPQIGTDGNMVFHCEWDNLNKTTTNVHGSKSVNIARGIMVREIKPGLQNQNQNVLMLPIMGNPNSVAE